jgi:hypothetical protein
MSKTKYEDMSIEELLKAMPPWKKRPKKAEPKPTVVSLASSNPEVPLERQRERLSEAQRRLIEDENRRLKEWEAQKKHERWLIVVTIADAQPDLKSQVCQLAGDYLENGETWAASFFKDEVPQPVASEVEVTSADSATPEVVKVAEADSAGGWGERRPLPPEPAEERPALRVQNKERAEASLFLNDSTYD